LAEFGPHYDSLNESVIPTVQNAAASASYGFDRAARAAAGVSICRSTCAAYFACSFGAEEGLAAPRFWGDHEASMTWFNWQGGTGDLNKKS
jgi:hypothetical protein